MNFHVVEHHPSSFERAPRVARACILCHARKVRCDVSHSKPQCTNCQHDGQRCQPRMRQQRIKHSARAAQTPINQTYSHDKPTTPSPPPQEPLATIRNLPRPALGEAMSQPRPQTSSLAARGPGENGQFPPGPSPASEVTTMSNTYESGYLGRSAYIAPDSFRDKDGSEVEYAATSPSEVNRKILGLQKALDLPPRAVRDALFENFWAYCYPWDPIIERSEMVGLSPEKMSPILLQAIFLAGSRMSASVSSYASPEEYYQRAKTLFYLDYEQDPVIMLTAVSLLHWWNPHGPERVSTNTSCFWSRVSVCLAQQMGLHSRMRRGIDQSRSRKIWWSLVARDCLISAAHGRPQAIHLDDCDVARPTLDDFPGATLTGLIFIAYVDLALITGRFTANALRRVSSKAHVTDIEDSLYRWISTLPEPLRLSPRNSPNQTNQFLKPYNFESRQIQVLYFVNLILLYRSRTLEGPFPVTTVIASSTVAGIFEEFLARDEVRLLGPMFTFHLLAAAIALLSCCRYASLWEVAEKDLKIISQAQEELRKKWPSATGSIKSFERMHKLALDTQKKVNALPDTKLSREHNIFFQDLDTSLCRMWEPLEKAGLVASAYSSSWNSSLNTMSQPGNIVDTSMDRISIEPAPHPVLAEPLDFDEIFRNEASQMDGGIGDWLFWDQNPNTLHFD